MNLVTSPHEFLHHLSLPSLVTVLKLGSVTVTEDEASETDLGRSWSRSIKSLCLPSRVFAEGFAVVSRVLQIGILRIELILRGHVEKACDKSMLLETVLIYVRCSLCTELTGKAIAKNWSCFLRFGFSCNLSGAMLWVVVLGCSNSRYVVLVSEPERK